MNYYSTFMTCCVFYYFYMSSIVLFFYIFSICSYLPNCFSTPRISFKAFTIFSLFYLLMVLRIVCASLDLSSLSSILLFIFLSSSAIYLKIFKFNYNFLYSSANSLFTFSSPFFNIYCSYLLGYISFMCLSTLFCILI